MSPVPTPPFVLSRATEADIDAIGKLEYQCFPPDIREIFLGCTSEADLPKMRDEYLRRVRYDCSDIWIKVECKATKRIIAASNWKVFPGNAPASSEFEDQPPSWLEGEALQKSTRIIKTFNERRRAANPGGYVHLHICFTDAAYGRRGAGAMMLKWGCDLADQLFLPAWVEASAEGNMLYKNFGFYDYEVIEEIGGVNMKRDPKVRTLEGGRPA